MGRRYYRVVLTAVLAGSLAGKAVCFPAYGIVYEGEASVSSAGEAGDGATGEGENPSSPDTDLGGGEGAPSPDADPDGGESPPLPDADSGGGEGAPSPDTDSDGEEGAPLPDADSGGEEGAPLPDVAPDEGEGAPPLDTDSGQGENPPPPDADSGQEENQPNPDGGSDEEDEGSQAPDSEQADNGQKEELENPGNIQQPEIPLQMIEIPLEEENKCDTVEELSELLAAGEEAVLTGDILVTGVESLQAAAEDEAVVDMNGYSIIVPDGGQLYVDGPIRFQGTAGDNALLQISGRAILKNGAQVWAEGNSAVAAEISGSKTGTYALETYNAYIGASGDNSIALKWKGKGTCSLQLAYIQAEGENSVGIDTDLPVELRLCLVEAEGNSIVTDKAIIVDVSEVTSLPEQSEVITREIYLDNRLGENGVSVEAGTDWQGLNDKLLQSATYAFYDSAGKWDTCLQTFELNWENLPEDLSEPGVYRAVITAEGYPDWFFIEIPDMEITIYVVAPETAHIEEIFRMEDLAVLRFLNPIEDAERIQLLCSADGGDTWQDAADMPGCSVEIDPLTIALRGLEVNHTYLFCAAVTGGPMEGLSSVKSFGYYEDDSDRFGHGDRDGDDRDAQGELPPWDSAPPPGDDFGNSGDSSGGNETGEMAGDETGTSDIPEGNYTERLKPTAAGKAEPPEASAVKGSEEPEPSAAENTENLGISAAGGSDMPGTEDGENSRESEREKAEISFYENCPRTEPPTADTVSERQEPAAEGIQEVDAQSHSKDNYGEVLFRTVLGAAAGIAVLTWYKGKSRRKP